MPQTPAQPPQPATLTVDGLRASGSRPRLHPSGFIQLDLLMDATRAGAQRGHSGGWQRLHVWDDSLDSGAGVDTAHDHVFDMHSRVLTGTLIQQRLRLNLEHGNEPTHEIHIASYSLRDGKPHSQLEPTGVLGVLEQAQTVEVRDGSEYTQPAFTFHRTGHRGLTATVMSKMHVYDADARVLIPLASDPKGASPGGNGDRSVRDEEPLWDLIADALRSS